MSRTQLFCTLLGAFIVLAVVGVVRRRNMPAPVSRDLSGGAKIQRERIDRVIENTSQLDIEEILASLSVYGESYALAGLASMSPSSLGHCFMKQIVADRRVSKVFEFLQSRSTSEASKQASTIFDTQFSILLSEWDRISNTPGDDSTDPRHHAASAGLFLCSYFCSPGVFEEKLSEWDEKMSNTTYDKIQGVGLSGSRYIDPLFRLNLLVISGDRNGQSTDILNQELETVSRGISGDSKPFLKIEPVKLFRWNAETLDTDFTHISRNVPASGNSVLLELPGFLDPDASLYLQDEQIFAKLEKTINKWRQGSEK